MISTETSDETISMQSTSSSSNEDYHEADNGMGGGDGPKQTSILIKPLRLEKNSLKTLRLPERRSLKKPKKLAIKTGILTKTNNTKIPQLSRENTKENLKVKQQNNANCLKKLHSPRYYSVIRRNFTSRKSFSQMNLREAKHIQKNNNNQAYNNNQLKNPQTKEPCQNYSDQRYEQAIEMNDSFYQIMRINGNTDEEQMAGMKIFATVILNAWRKRRDEVKELQDEIGRVKRMSIKVKNQIHVLNSMFRIEQKQNDELNVRLRRMVEDQRKVRNSYDELNQSHKDLENKSSKLQSQLDIKEEEIEGLEALLDETKSELFKSMANEREFECELSMEQKNVQELEINKTELYNQLNELKSQLYSKQGEVDEIKAEKNQQINKLYEQLCFIEKKMEEINEKDKHYRELIKQEIIQTKQIDELSKEVNSLKNQINSTLLKRIRKYLYEKRSIPYVSFKILHLMTFYLLPSVPPPMKVDLPKLSTLQQVIMGLKLA